MQGATLSRSRPYHKNDNRFVEQKNSTLVRAYLGHDRLDTVAQTIAVNQPYDKVWVYYNLFQPVMRLVEKIVIPVEGQATRVKRHYDQARTPFDRLCQTNAITQQRREQLQSLRDQTNPRQLQQEIYDLIDYIFSLPNAIPGQRENVHLTLATHLDLESVPLPFTLPDPTCPLLPEQVDCGYVDNSPQAPSCPHIHNLYYDLTQHYPDHRESTKGGGKPSNIII